MIFESSCAGCERPGPVLCTTCRMALLGRPPCPAPDGVITVLPYAGRVRDIMLGLKYHNRRAVGRHLAGLLVNRLVALGVHNDIDVVTWAPTTPSRRRGRGFDQAEIIARTVARQLHVPCRRLLERRGPGAAQTGRSRSERMHAPRFVARPDVGGERILLVDDVVTTGSTLRSGREALEARGASVLATAVAATPGHSSAAVTPAVRREPVWLGDCVA